MKHTKIATSYHFIDVDKHEATKEELAMLMKRRKQGKFEIAVQLFFLIISILIFGYIIFVGISFIISILIH